MIMAFHSSNVVSPRCLSLHPGGVYLCESASHSDRALSPQSFMLQSFQIPNIATCDAVG